MASVKQGPDQRSTRRPYCALASCLHHHPLKRLCMIGLRRTAGECPEYRPRKKEPATQCHRSRCAHYYQDDWRRRCQLGHRMPEGKCKDYTPKPNTSRPKKKIPTCSKSSCVHWYREEGRYRCRLGFPAGQVRTVRSTSRRRQTQSGNLRRRPGTAPPVHRRNASPTNNRWPVTSNWQNHSHMPAPLKKPKREAQQPQPLQSRPKRPHPGFSRAGEIHSIAGCPGHAWQGEAGENEKFGERQQKAGEA